MQAAREAAHVDVIRLRISCPPSALQEIVPGIVTKFHEQYPKVKLDLFTFHTSTTLSALQDESIDIGYVRLPVEARGLQVVAVHQEPFVVCLPPDHRLVTKKHIYIADLRDEKFILYGRKWATGFHDRMMEVCREAGFTPDVVSEIDEMYLAPTLVAAGLGITILPRMVVSSRGAGIVVRELTEHAVLSEIGVAARSVNMSSLVSSIFDISKVIGRRYSRELSV